MQVLDNLRLQLADLDQALRLKPDDAQTYRNRGSVKGKLEQPRLAIADLIELIHLRPDYVRAAYYNRGMARNHLGQLKAAQTDSRLHWNWQIKLDDANLKTQVEQLLQKLDDAD